MTYGQRQRAAERRMQRSLDEGQRWYESLTAEQKDEFDRKAQVARERLLGNQGKSND